MDPAETSSPFDPARREIFPYRDGRGPRRADPLAVDRRMLEAMRDVDEEALHDHLNAPDFAVQLGAVDKLLPAIRHAFRVAALEDDEEAGLTDEETLDLYTDFVGWRDGLKGDTGPAPSTSPPTDDGPASAPITSAGTASC